MFSVLRRRDVLLHHPYDSFKPVIRLLEQASADSNVRSFSLLNTNKRSAAWGMKANVFAGVGNQANALSYRREFSAFGNVVDGKTTEHQQ